MKAESDLIESLRALLEDERCLCSSAHTDWQGVAALLDEVEASRRLIRRLTALQREWARRSEQHLADAKNRIDAGMGGAYSVASESLRHLLRDTSKPSGSPQADQ